MIWVILLSVYLTIIVVCSFIRIFFIEKNERAFSKFVGTTIRHFLVAYLAYMVGQTGF